MASNTSGQVPSAGNKDIKKNRDNFKDGYVRVTAKYLKNMTPAAKKMYEAAKESGNIPAVNRSTFEGQGVYKGLKDNSDKKITGLVVFDSRTYEPISKTALFGKTKDLDTKYATIDNRDIYDTDTGYGGRATPTPKTTKEKPSGKIPTRQGKAMGGYTERWRKSRGG